jgi:hypothetical protein
LDGVLDWLFRRKKEETTGLPAPAKERGGMTSFFAPGPPAAVREPSGRSIFDLFRPKAGPPAVVREERAPISAAFAPGAPQPLAPIIEPMTQAFKPGTPGPMETLIAPLVAPMQEVFRPSAEEVFEAHQARQMSLWTGLFPDETETLGDLTQPFAPGETVPEEKVAEQYGYDPDDVKILPLPPRDTLLPTPEDVARGWLTWMTPNFWDYLGNWRNDESFQEELRQRVEYGEEDEPVILNLESLGECSDAYSGTEGLALFFGIPWGEVLAIGDPDGLGIGPEHDDWDWDAIAEEIIWPISDIFTDAMDLITPPDIPGYFVLGECDCGMTYVINYAEQANPDMPVVFQRPYVKPEPETVEEEESEEEPEEEPEKPAPKPKKKAKKKKRR